MYVWARDPLSVHAALPQGLANLKTPASAFPIKLLNIVLFHKNPIQYNLKAGARALDERALHGIAWQDGGMKGCKRPHVVDQRRLDFSRTAK